MSDRQPDSGRPDSRCARCGKKLRPKVRWMGSWSVEVSLGHAPYCMNRGLTVAEATRDGTGWQPVR